MRLVLPRCRPVACLLLLAGWCQAQIYVISTVAGGAPPAAPAFGITASLGSPQYITTDKAGDAYFTSLNCVFKLFPNGVVTLVAGSSRPGYSGDGGQAINAQLSSPIGLAVDAAGNIFIADSGNNRIREVAVSGIITTVAGNGAAGFSGDKGAAVAAQFSAPAGVALDSSGNLFIADTGNNRVRKVSARGIVSTVAGNGAAAYAGDGAPATGAQLSATSIALDTAGDLFIADSANYRVREVSLAGIITTVAGTGTSGFTGNGSFGPNAEFSTIHELAIDPNGTIYIADTGNSTIRTVASGTGYVSSVAGSGNNAFFGDQGPAINAALAFPFGVALDSSGNIFIADSGNNRIREVSTNGVINTVAGNGLLSDSGDSAAAVAAQLNGPQAVALDNAGNLLIADTSNFSVREVLASGVIGTVAGNGSAGNTGDGGQPTKAQLSAVRGVAGDGEGDLFIADSGNYRVREVTQGFISTIAGTGSSFSSGDGGLAVNAGLSVAGMATDALGNLLIADPVNHSVRRIDLQQNITTVAGNGTAGFSGDNGLATSAKLSNPAAVAVDAAGNLYVADSGNHTVRRVSSSGTITTIAGTGVAGFSGDGGAAASAQLNSPAGVAVDASGNVYIADTGNNRVRKVSAAGTISTIAGNGVSGYLGDGGGGANAELSQPMGLTLTKTGNLYVADAGNNAIRLLTPITPALLISAVVDAASETPVAISPGKIVVIYGTGLGPSQLAINQPVNGVFGQQLAGTTVAFRGISAPLYYTSSTQVAAIVPYEVEGTGSVPVVVSYQGQLATAFNATLAASSPGLFTSNATGAGQAAAINVVDGTLNSATNPVKIGSYISLYATGEGQTNPSGVDGKLAAGVYPQPLLKVSVTVGGVAATFNYAGAAPGEVAGLMQVNVLIPAGVTPGPNIPVVLTVGSASTVSGAVSIAVSN